MSELPQGQKKIIDAIKEPLLKEIESLRSECDDWKRRYLKELNNRLNDRLEGAEEEAQQEIESLRSFKASALITIQSLRDDKKKLQSILTRERELMAADTDIQQIIKEE